MINFHQWKHIIKSGYVAIFVQDTFIIFSYHIFFKNTSNLSHYFSLLNIYLWVKFGINYGHREPPLHPTILHFAAQVSSIYVYFIDGAWNAGSSGRAFGWLIMNIDRIYVNRSLNIDFVNFAFTAKVLVFGETLKNVSVLDFLSFQVFLDFNISY